MRHSIKGFLLLQIAATVLLYATPNVPAQTNDSIVLNVTVTTDKGIAVAGLSAENFSVNVDKRPQTVLSFKGEVPVSVGILIDTSESVNMYTPKSLTDFKQHLKAGLERFVQLGNPANEYFVMTFNNDIDIVQDWTNDPVSVTKKLDLLEYKGQTSLYDAIGKAVPKVMTGRNAKHVLIIFSDGNDTYSRSMFKDVRETLKRSDVVLYAVGVTKVTSDPIALVLAEGASILDEYASNSGGRASFSNNPSKSDAFTKPLESIALELRSQYQLVIRPEASAGKEKWHKLNVSAVKNDVSGRPQKLLVRTRQGYFR